MSLRELGALAGRVRLVPGEDEGGSLELLLRVLPLPEYRRGLDSPCGDGRLTRPLRELGYEVTPSKASRTSRASVGGGVPANSRRSSRHRRAVARRERPAPLRVRLPPTQVDVFEWQLYTAADLTEPSAQHGLRLLETVASPLAP